MPESLDEGLIGHAQLLVAAPGQHDRAGGVDGSRQLRRQARLAHPRLAGDEGHPPLAGHRLLPERFQAGDFDLPPDEHPPGSGHDGRQRQGGGRRLPGHLAGRHRVG